MISSSFFLAPAQASDEVQLENWPVVRVGPAGTTLEPSAVLDDGGAVHLLYLHRDPAYPDWYLRPSYLRYVNCSQGTWEHADLQEGFFSFADMALDADGGVHILCAVRDNTSTDIVYWSNTNGTWASESVAQVDTDGSKNIDMDVDGEGKVHAVMGFEGNEGENITYHYVSNANGDGSSYPSIPRSTGWRRCPCRTSRSTARGGRTSPTLRSKVSWRETIPPAIGSSGSSPGTMRNGRT